MSLRNINLSPALTERDLDLVLGWLHDPRTMARADWPDALAAFDSLRRSTLEWQGRAMTFGEFYDEFVEEPFASPCLQELMTLTAPTPAGHTILAGYARRLREALMELLPERPLPLPSRVLLAHCLYWWNAFGKGYLYELIVFTDLRAAGIEFTAHDLSQREGRRSPYDLMVLERKGDVKFSTYFLHVARGFPLRHDFYITRLYAVAQRRWQDVVILRPEVWAELDGEAQPTVLENALHIFPTAAEVQLRGSSYIVIDYVLWKEKVKARQQAQREVTSDEQEVDGNER